MDDKRFIDANELKYIEPDANAYSEEWNADYEKGFRDCLDKVMALPTVEAQSVKQDTELSLILQDYSIKDTDTLRYILDQYQKIIVDITGGQMSYLTYPAQAVIECTNDYYLSALADFKENLVKHGQWIDHEELIGIFGTLCDYMVDNCKCDVFCPYAETKDKNGECEAWRTIQKIRQES